MTSALRCIRISGCRSKEPKEKGVENMFNKEEVCQKVKELNPDLGACDVDIETHYSTAKKSWIIVSKKGGHDIVHSLDKMDIKNCLDGVQCFSLGLDVAELTRL